MVAHIKGQVAGLAGSQSFALALCRSESGCREQSQIVNRKTSLTIISALAENLWLISNSFPHVSSHLTNLTGSNLTQIVP